MVGLKTFWILISALFLFSACVPSTKQTECKSNESFNPSLRTCVPVVQGPDAFILVDTYSPAGTITAYKYDTDAVEFRITVSNPYGQQYSIEWERSFNGLPVSVGTNSPVYAFPPSILSSQVGLHTITVKLKNKSGVVVDTHPFQLMINDAPKPRIRTTTLVPTNYTVDIYPTDAPVEFSFTVQNNNASIAVTDNYRIQWNVTKNGAAYYTEDDAFTDYTSTGTNTAYLGVSPTPFFDPAVLGVGNYTVRAKVDNQTPGEVVDDFQWNITIKQPPLANVTTVSHPATGVTFLSHHNVDYNDYPANSWIYSGTTQPNFCVTVDDRDGTYAGDGQTLQVRYYLDSLGGEICTKKTLDTPGTQTVCLVDNPLDAIPDTNCDPDGANVPFDTNLLRFTNASATSEQLHKVTARIYDERTSLELNQNNVRPGNGSYPIEWVTTTKPANTAPAMTFGTVNPTGCTSAGAFTRTACKVTQGTNFTVSFIVNDDFYFPIANPGEFLWDVRLKYNGADVSSPPTNTTCTKAFGTAVTVPAASGPATSVTGGQQWTCTIAVPHFISTGPLNPLVGTYSVVASMQDSGSPVGGAGLISQSLTWNLTVTESNPSGISIAPQTALLADSHIAKGVSILDPNDTNSYATELETVTFRLNVTDNELDDFKYRISLCTINSPTTCSASTPITSPSYVDFLRAIQVTPATNPVLVSGLLYTLPEDLLLQVTPSLDLNLTTSGKVYFKVDVIDTPSAPLTATVTDTEIFGLYVRNYNPAPVINTASAVPAVGSTTVVQSGYQITIDPGTITDASVPVSERTIQYQWYSKIGAGAWTAISGATTEILKYTPGNISSNIDLKICVGDRPAANPISSTGNCSGSWTITPKPYLSNLAGSTIVDPTDPLTWFNVMNVSSELAVWYDDTNSVPNTHVIYSAYVDYRGADRYIFVEKTVKDGTGTTTLSVNSISFRALFGAATTNVTNLSITGNADSLYVAYIASNPSAPSTMAPRVRKIDKGFSTGVDSTGTKTGLAHPGRFGFNYTHYTLTESCATCIVGNGDGAGGPAGIQFTASAIVDGETITINGLEFTAEGTNPAAADEFCASPYCSSAGDTAIHLASKINSSTDPRLHGITAYVDGNNVLLYGQYANDFLDFDGTMSPVPSIVVAPNGMGKIFIHGGRWYIPVINSSLAGSQQNNVSMISGATTETLDSPQGPVHLQNLTELAYSTNNVLSEMGKTALFDAKLDTNGHLVVARISSEITDAGALALYRYENTGLNWTLLDVSGGSAFDQNSMDIFNSYSFEYVKLATNTVGNPYHYVIAREKTVAGGEYHIGRYHPDLDTAYTPSENFISTRLSATDSTSDVISDTKMKFPDIVSVPDTSEARIVFHSVGAGVLPHPRIARWKADNTISCGTCDSLNGSVEYLTTAKIGISQVVNNVTLGTAGTLAGENTRDVIFTLFSADIAHDDNFRAQLGIINIQAEGIQSTTVDATGMWRPPFAK